MAMACMDTIEKQVLKRIKPSDEEKKRLESTVSYIMQRAGEIAAENKIQGVELQLVGSAARGTWISGTHDLDIFISFDISLPRKKLEEYGLFIGHQLAKEADKCEECYAEHPYTRLRFSGFDVDIVPCYRVKNAGSIISAVDRTPFHNIFVKEHIRGLEDEVLLLKQFMKAGGVYGSDLKTGGFSGYLAELLVIHYGSFENVLQAATSWMPGSSIGMAGGTHVFEEVLVFIDPTDAGRNVAAALTREKFAQFISMSRDYIRKPSETFFQNKQLFPMSDAEIRAALDKRSSGVIAVCFPSPDVVEDILYPQLFKMQKSVESMLKNHDFHVIKTNVWAGENAILTIELENGNLSNVRKHFGPPVWVKDHAEIFKEKYVNDPDTFCFYIEEDRYVVEVPRKFPHAKDLLEAELPNYSLGKHISECIQKGYEVLADEDMLRITDKGFRAHLRNYL